MVVGLGVRVGTIALPDGRMCVVGIGGVEVLSNGGMGDIFRYG